MIKLLFRFFLHSFFIYCSIINIYATDNPPVNCNKNMYFQILMAKDSDLDFIKIMQLNDNELFLVYDCQSFLQNISIYSVNNLSTPICEPLYVSEKYCVDSLNKIYNSIDALNIPEIYINFNKQKIKLNSSSIH